MNWAITHARLLKCPRSTAAIQPSAWLCFRGWLVPRPDIWYVNSWTFNVEAANRTAGASAVTGGSQTHVFPTLTRARRPRVNWSHGKGSQRLSLERPHCWLAARSIIQKQYLWCVLLLMYVHMGSRPLKPLIAIAWSCLTHFMQGTVRYSLIFTSSNQTNKLLQGRCSCCSRISCKIVSLLDCKVILSVKRTVHYTFVFLI